MEGCFVFDFYFIYWLDFFSKYFKNFSFVFLGKIVFLVKLLCEKEEVVVGV